MAQKRRPNKQTKPAYPTGIHWCKIEDDYYLHKKFGKKIIKDPYYITDDLEEIMQEIEESATKWNIKPNFGELKKFIDKHNNNEKNEETVIFKDYFSK